jgi:hypothetical protein
MQVSLDKSNYAADEAGSLIDGFPNEAVHVVSLVGSTLVNTFWLDIGTQSKQAAEDSATTVYEATVARLRGDAHRSGRDGRHRGPHAGWARRPATALAPEERPGHFVALAHIGGRSRPIALLLAKIRIPASRTNHPDSLPGHSRRR